MISKEFSDCLNPDILFSITKILNVTADEIQGIRMLKKGMTNRSFLFSCKGSKYIMRVPGEGTELLINRKHEAQVYKVIENKGLCDNAIYFNSDNGYKITRFLKNARVCDPDNLSDVKICMDKLRNFHHMRLIVGHEFDLFERINFYESLWNGRPSIYQDYKETKRNVYSLRNYVQKYRLSYCLTHIDAVPDNFLFYIDDTGVEKVHLTDWEYAGMQDPHVDIAMFCIYSFYDKERIDRLIHIYFEGNCLEKVRIKIYCYIAICGLLWSNWCEYKQSQGVEFGQYSERQYRYAKEYFRIAKKEMETTDALCK